MIENWLSKNLNDSLLGRIDEGLNISGIAAYQPSDGLMELKVVLFLFPFPNANVFLRFRKLSEFMDLFSVRNFLVVFGGKKMEMQATKRKRMVKFNSI